MAKTTGRVEIIVNGELLFSKVGATAMNIGFGGGVAREITPIIGENQVTGYASTVLPPQLDVTVTDRDDVPLDRILRIGGDGTVIFRASGGGKTYTLNDAVCSGAATITSGEGDTTLIFYGSSWSESVQ